MTEQERFERYQAAEIRMNYEEFKRRLDEYERITGDRYGKNGQFFKEWKVWSAAAQQKEGYVLVPIEPTDEALDRAVAFALQVGLSSDYRWTDYMRDLYARFLNLPDSKQQHRSRHETKTHD